MTRRTELAAVLAKVGYVIVLLSSAVPASHAVAQDAALLAEDEAARAEARSLFEAGTEALRAERFEDAVEMLSRSHALLPNVANAFNLAVALQRLSRVIESLALLGEIDREAFGALGVAQRVAVAERISEGRAAIATLRISVARAAGAEGTREAGPTVADVSVDERAIAQVTLGDTTSPSSTEVDPGEHRVAVRAPGFVSEGRTIDVRPGSVTTVALVLRADDRAAVSARASDATAPSPPPSNDGETWAWVLSSIALAAIGGGIAIGVVLSSGPAAPVVDPVTGIGETLVGGPLAMRF